jgi:hypothetical protein
MTYLTEKKIPNFIYFVFMSLLVAKPTRPRQYMIQLLSLSLSHNNKCVIFFVALLSFCVCFRDTCVLNREVGERQSATQSTQTEPPPPAEKDTTIQRYVSE